MADITQAFDDMFQYDAFQVYLNTDYVQCGYVWGGYVDPNGMGTTKQILYIFDD